MLKEEVRLYFWDHILCPARGWVGPEGTFCCPPLFVPQLSTGRPSGVQSAVLHGSDRVAPYFSLVQIPGKQSKVLSESIRRVGEEMRSLPGWGGINNGIRDFRYNLYAPVLLGIQLQGLQGCSGWSSITGQECSETLYSQFFFPICLFLFIHSFIYSHPACFLKATQLHPL